MAAHIEAVGPAAAALLAEIHAEAFPANQAWGAAAIAPMLQFLQISLGNRAVWRRALLAFDSIACLDAVEIEEHAQAQETVSTSCREDCGN